MLCQSCASLQREYNKKRAGEDMLQGQPVLPQLRGDYCAALCVHNMLATWERRGLVEASLCNACLLHGELSWKLISRALPIACCGSVLASSPPEFLSRA